MITAQLTIRNVVSDKHLDRIVDLINNEAYVSDIQVLSILLYTEGDALELTHEAAQRLVKAGLAHPNASIAGTPDDDGALRLSWVFAAPGDQLLESSRWMYQTGNQWVAVSETESEANWFEDDSEAAEWPTPRVRDIHDLPATGLLFWKDENGQGYMYNIDTNERREITL